MATARQQALMARRTSYTGPFGDSRRILAPRDTGISSIAKKSAANETELTIAKYNAGEIGNADMKAFFQKQLGNQYVTESDKVDIQKKLVDFDALIEKDKLEATFKLAQDNSIQKAQAATALADFYKMRASSMVEGTPAHSQALENAGIWEQNRLNIQESTNKEQQKNYKNQMLQMVNAIPDGSQKSAAASEMYKKLYDLAIQQGDQESAQIYEANRQNELQNAAAYQESEKGKTAREQRSEIVNGLNMALNDYNDGRLSADELYQVLNAVDQYALENNDGVLQNKVNAETTRIAKIEAKGGLNRTTVGGLTAIVSKGAGGTATQTDIDKQNFSDNIRLIQEMFVNGNDGQGNAYTEEQFKEDMKEAVGEWQGKLTNFFDEAQSLNSENPNAYVYWNGKKRKVGDVIDEIQNEYNKVAGIEQAIDEGTLAVVQKDESSVMGKNIPLYELRDLSGLNAEEKELLKQDTSGVFYKGAMGEEVVSGEEEEAAKLALLSGDTSIYRFDKTTGKYFKNIGMQFNMVDPITGKRTQGLLDEQTGRVLPKDYAEEIKSLGYKAGDVLEFNPEKAAKVTEQQAAMTAEQLTKHQETINRLKGISTQETQKPSFLQQAREVTDKLLPGRIISPVPTEAKPITQQVRERVIEPVGEAIKGVTDQATEAIKPVIQQVQPTIQQAVQRIQPAITQAPISYVAPKVAQVVQPVAQKVQQTISTPSGQYAPAVKLADIYKTGVSNIAQAGQAVAKAAQPVVQNIGTKISSAWNWLTGKKK